MNLDRPAPSATALASAALLLGILCDYLFRVPAWGLNVVVAGIALVAVAAWAYRPDPNLPPRLAAALGLEIVLLALGYVSRSGPNLRALDILGIVVALGLGMVTRRSVQLVAMRAADVGTGVLDVFANAFRAPPALVAAMAAEPTASVRVTAGRVGAGALIAMPLLIIFGILLSQADPIFSALAQDLLHFDLASVASHLFLTAVWGAGAAGILWGATRWRGAPRAPRGEPSIGAIEATTGLGLITAMFTVFVGLQARYLFGGAAFVLSTTGVTYAEYARHGFFELLTVVGLALPLLLFTHAQIPDHGDATRTLSALARIMTGLLGLVAISAASRLQLYASMYGLTEARIVAGGAIAWQLGTLAWFALTVQRGRPRRFVAGSGTLACVILVALHALNPDALAMKTQIDRAMRGAPLDSAYVRSLGGDAIVPLLKAFPRLSANDQCVVRRAIPRGSDTDWRSWTLADMRGRHAIERSQVPAAAEAEGCELGSPLQRH